MSARSIPAVLAVLLLLTAGAGAEQLGGAYRGPYPEWSDGHPRWPGSGGLGAGRRVDEDVLAFWPFWFEHNKEWLLAERIRTRRADARDLAAEHRGEVLPLLIAGLSDESSFVRDAAVLALGKLGSPEAVKPIADRLEKETDSAVRRSALLALGLTREEAALRPLFLEFRDGSHDRPWAVIGMALLGRKEPVPEFLGKWRETLAAPPELRRIWRADRVLSLAVALGTLGDEEITDTLGTPLKATRWTDSERIASCHALSLLGGERSRKWLLFGGLKHRSADTRGAAAFGLCGQPAETVLKYLVGRHGVAAADRMQKLGAVVGLGILGSRLPEGDALRRGARAALLDCLHSRAKDFYASMWASLALGFLGGEKARDALRQRLDEFLRERARVRDAELSAVVMGLGFIGDKSSAPRIRSLMEDPGQAPEVRGYAAFALGIMGDHESLDAIRGLLMAGWRRPNLVRPALWAVGLLGDEGDVPWLLEGLKVRGPEWHTVRGAAAIAIGLVGGSDAVRRLLRFIGKAEDNTDRAFAIAALGMLLDKDPVPRIPLLFRNYNYRELPRFARQILLRL